MKPNLSVEFLRGLLFSYVVYHFYDLINALLFGAYHPESREWIGLAIAGVFIIIYTALGYALLFTPKGYARFTTIFLALIVLIHLFSVLFWSQHAPPGLPSPFNRVLITQLAFGSLIVALAYLYQRLLKRKEASAESGG